MKKIIVASTNPVKINATKRAFEKVFPEESFVVKGYSIASGVSDQPKSDDETLQGATNRANTAQKKHPKADYWVGIEGGVDYHLNEMFTFAWIIVQSKKRIGRSKTGTLLIAPKARKMVELGMELGGVDDVIFGKKNTKQERGSIGLLTNNLITRTDYYEQAIICALVPFVHPTLYTE